MYPRGCLYAKKPSLYLSSWETRLNTTPCLAVKYSFNPNGPLELSRFWLDSFACGHCPGYYVHIEDEEESYANREIIVFQLCKLIFTWKTHMLMHIQNEWPSAIGTLFLLAMSEEMPEVEQSGCPQTAMLKHQGRRLLCTSPQTGLHSEHQVTNIPPWKPAKFIHYVEEGRGSWVVTVRLCVMPVKKRPLWVPPEQNIIFLRASS